MDLVELLRLRHPDYTGPLGCRWWKLCRDATDGGGGFRHAVEYASQDVRAEGDWTNTAALQAIPSGSYLARFDRETPKQFVGRLRSSHYRNHLKRILATYAGHLWRRPPERSTTHAAVERWWRDVDGEGTGIVAWLQRGARDGHLIGWSAAYFDRDPVDGVASLATAHTSARWLKPEEIVDWELAADGGFRWVRLCTTVTSRDAFTGASTTSEEYTTWTPDWWWRVVLATDAEGRVHVVANTGQVPHTLGRVPVVVFYWEPRADTERLYATSHMASAVSAALELFNVGSEARHVERGTAFPILYAQSADPKVFDNLKLGVHNGVVVELEAKIPPGMFSAPPEINTHFEARRRELREEVYHAVSLDPPSAEAVAPESGVARAYRFLGQRAALAASAQQLARFERDCLDLVVRWDTPGVSPEALAEMQGATTLTYPQDFDVQDAASVIDTHGKVLAAREQLAPVTVATSRRAIGRAVDPQPTAESERALTEQVSQMYERDVTALKPDPAVPGKTRPGGTGANGGGNGPAAGA